jgi:hypothetical protein
MIVLATIDGDALGDAEPPPSRELDEALGEGELRPLSPLPTVPELGLGLRPPSLRGDGSGEDDAEARSPSLRCPVTILAAELTAWPGGDPAANGRSCSRSRPCSRSGPGCGSRSRAAASGGLRLVPVVGPPPRVTARVGVSAGVDVGAGEGVAVAVGKRASVTACTACLTVYNGLSGVAPCEAYTTALPATAAVTAAVSAGIQPM